MLVQNLEQELRVSIIIEKRLLYSYTSNLQINLFLKISSLCKMTKIDGMFYETNAV